MVEGMLQCVKMINTNLENLTREKNKNILVLKHLVLCVSYHNTSFIL